MLPQPPLPSPAHGLLALRALLHHRSLLPALSSLHRELGDVFRLPLPAFSPIVLAGPEAARFVLVSARSDFRWRIDTDPVARLFRHGLLVEDGPAHDQARDLILPALHRRYLETQINLMVACVDEVTAGWQHRDSIELLPEMRRIALLILMRTLFSVDPAPHLAELWPPLLRALDYISPGLWIVWPGVPRPGYDRALRQLDNYLFQLITARRAAAQGTDLLSLLIESGHSDDLIRDQLLTLLIAGHDTSTALLSWALILLCQHQAVRQKTQSEIDSSGLGQTIDLNGIGQLVHLERVIKETLRLYPPIHVGNRITARDLDFRGRRLPAGNRVLFSIFLTHRHPAHWPEPDRFNPDRFDPNQSPPPAPFTYLPFGGGPRYCVGAAMAQLEARVVLARLLQRWKFELRPGPVNLRMGATLEPAPNLRLSVRVRSPDSAQPP